MSKRMVVLGSVVAVVSLVFVVLVVVAGCPKEKPVAQVQPQEKMPMPEQTSGEQVAAKPVAGEQTNCPVMGGAINKDIFVEYQGKKVYFCCKGCPDVFKADPAKYLAKLPQFAQ